MVRLSSARVETTFCRKSNEYVIPHHNTSKEIYQFILDWLYVYWKDPVKRRWRRFSTGTRDRAKAEYALGEFLVKHSLDIGCEEIRPPEGFFVITALQQYVRERKHDLKTIDLANRCADSLIKFFGSHAKVSHLTPQALEQYEHERTRKPRVIRKKDGLVYVEDRRPVTKGTVRRELSVLSSALTHAIKYRRLTSAPKVYKPIGSENRTRFLNKTEIQALLANCVAPHVKLFVVLAINTGARRGALLELKWDQVDLVSRILYLNPNGREQTKKFRSIVPINDPLYEALVATKKEQEVLVLKKREKTGEDIPFYDHVIIFNSHPQGYESGLTRREAR